MKTKSLVLTIAVQILLGVTARGETVSGRVAVSGRGNRAPAKTVVYAEPLEGESPVRTGQFKLPQQNKSFGTSLLAIPAGSTVDFPNQDPIFHNVFSLSRPEPFDLGLYRAGASKSRAFTKPATYRVFCNIHPQMTAVILVLPTSYVTEVDASGNFRLELPAGRYRLTAWSERAPASKLEITVGSSTVQVSDLTLDESKHVELPHKNKYGQDYPKAAYDAVRGELAR